MKKHFIYVAMAAMVLTGCINSDYDLSDIDTTSRITVNGLTVPIKIAPVHLDDIIDLGEEGDVQKNELGEYYFIKSGDFQSDPILVNKFTAKGVSTSRSVDFPLTMESMAKTRAANVRLASAEIPKEKVSLQYSANGLDDAIVDIKNIGITTTIALKLKFNGLTDILNTLHLKDLQLKTIAGLDATVNHGTYNPKEGTITISEAETDPDHSFTLALSIKGIDAQKAGITLKNNRFEFNSEPGVLNGRIEVYSDDLKTITSLPSSIGFEIAATSDDITVNTFSGDIKYDLSEGLNVDPISLTSLPDVLTQSGTKIKLGNPQIYLSVNNPLAEKGYTVSGQLGISFVNEDSKAEHALANDAIKIKNAENNFCLAPQQPASYFVKADNTEYVKFTELSDIIYGERVPSSIGVKILDPKIPVQTITDFRLGEQLSSVKGTWTFMAPLAITEDSKVSYVKEWDDWGDEDLDGLTVNKATISAQLASDVEMDLNVSVTLLGGSGKLNGTTTLKKGENQFSLDLAGQPLSNIYGAKVEVSAAGTGKPLGPNQTITISNLKANFDGYYETDF